MDNVTQTMIVEVNRANKVNLLLYLIYLAKVEEIIFQEYDHKHLSSECMWMHSAYDRHAVVCCLIFCLDVNLVVGIWAFKNKCDMSHVQVTDNG